MLLIQTGVAYLSTDTALLRLRITQRYGGGIIVMEKVQAEQSIAIETDIRFGHMTITKLKHWSPKLTQLLPVILKS